MNKKIISFSLYGNKPNFQVGAVVNVLEAKRLYPDWKCRFYTTDNDAICKQLEYLGAEIVRMDDCPEGQMLWRFLAVDDADVCLSRDTDSVVNEREVGAVNEWLENTDYQWHVMHDHKQHQQPIMGGMWGFKKGMTIGFEEKSMKNHIDEWIKNENQTDKYGLDQEFLKKVILPFVKRNSLTHGYRGKEFPEHLPCRYGNFVGDYSFFIGGWGEFVDGDKSNAEDGNPYYTHRPFLQRELDRLRLKRDSVVIELGTGDGSSLLMHKFAKQNPTCKIIAFETNPDWLTKQRDKYQLDNYVFHLLPSYSELRSVLTERADIYDLVFVDSAPWQSRIDCIEMLKSQASVFVVHDYDYFQGQLLEVDIEGRFWSRYSDDFTLEANFNKLPPTLVMTKKKGQREPFGSPAL